MLKIMKLHPDAMLPTRGSAEAAGLDLYAVQSVSLLPGGVQRVPTGLAIQISEGYVGLIWPRSGLAVNHKLDTMAGVIDSDFRAELQVVMINHDSNNVYFIQKGERIAQMIIQRHAVVAIEEVAELDTTKRGGNGFGSTGD